MFGQAAPLLQQSLSPWCQRSPHLAHLHHSNLLTYMLTRIYAYDICPYVCNVSVHTASELGRPAALSQHLQQKRSPWLELSPCLTGLQIV